MSVKREIPKDVYGMVLQRLRDKAKADCLNPNVQWWNGTLAGSTSDTDATESHRFYFRRWYALLGGRCVANAFKGMCGEPTSR